MKTIKIVLLLLAGILLCSAAKPQNANYEKKIDKFLLGILKGEIDNSYNELVSGTLIETKKQEMQMIKDQTRMIVNIHGNGINYEFIKKQKYGDSIVRLMYIIKCEKMPIAFEFYFYKASTNWKLIHFYVSDELDLLANK